jgi:hypothetical protein
MARAYNVHIVQLLNHNRVPQNVVAAFTVKHELETWLKRQKNYTPNNLCVVTIKDGGHGCVDSWRYFNEW